MVDARWFDTLEAIARSTRDSGKPFGGIQVSVASLMICQSSPNSVGKLVVCGDFFQLPPVQDNLQAQAGIPTSFAFEARSWNTCITTMITLTQVFRQKQPGKHCFVVL